MPNIDTYLPIWPGSSSFFPGDTPFGFYDSDAQFQTDIDATAEWCARRLGYGLSDVELQDKHFFAAFEEAINEYGYLVNTYAARDNMYSLLGVVTGSNLSQTYINPSFNSIFRIAKEYGNVIGSGGNLTWYTGSIELLPSKQIYDLTSDAIVETGSLSNGSYTIRKIFHSRTPAITRYYDPTFGNSYIQQEFGFTGISSTNNYLVLPLHHDILRVQAVELNDEIRRSTYSFQLTNNRLRIFPIPLEREKLYFHYTLDSDSSPYDSANGNNTKISDHSNIPYMNLSYSKINEIGRQWIRKYTLAVCKEILGYIRSKYQSIPIPDGEVTLNGSDLLQAGKDERDSLTNDLKEILDQMSRQTQLERKQAEAEALNKQLSWFPTKIYVR